ncbi:ubiquitin-conjugating enzyme E2 S [Gonapodya sp. JEL0774]|nr:ubiquitin-conjugating enzyme E2 S [Gonapodya sp. JEL0774]
MSAPSLPPPVLRTLLKDISVLRADPPEGIHLVVDDANVADIQAWIDGPVGTPYEAGAYLVRLLLSPDHPISPPKGFFLTKIFHPNVGPGGEICVDTLKREWKKGTSVGEVLVTIKCLLIAPNPDSALNQEAGKLLLEEYDRFAQRARVFAEVYGGKRMGVAHEKGQAQEKAQGRSKRDGERGDRGDRGERGERVPLLDGVAGQVPVAVGHDGAQGGKAGFGYGGDGSAVGDENHDGGKVGAGSVGGMKKTAAGAGGMVGAGTGTAVTKKKTLAGAGAGGVRKEARVGLRRF